MHYLVRKGSVKGEIAIPPSKSHTLRAVLFASLAKGKSAIHRYLPSPDTFAMIEACRLLGATIHIAPDILQIEGINGKIRCAEDVINACNSGIVLRFCAALGALSAHPIVITGDHSIRHLRPMQPLLDGLSQLGVKATSMRGDGYAPVIIQGPITKDHTTLTGEDSQPVSALLIAAALADRPIAITVKNAGEKPWIALTLDWFDRLGILYQNESFAHYRLQGNSAFYGFDYTVPGDFSSAAFPIAAALVTGSELVVKNVDMKDTQGDKELVSVFQKMGAQIEIDSQHQALHVKQKSSLLGIHVDINNFVDAITILAVVACFAEGETRICNAAIVRQKECNRIASITAELKKMGADITESDDGLIIRKSSLTGAPVHSYHDHRMAMSLTVAALGAKGEASIGPIECVAKTYPTFVRDFNAIGANIDEVKL